MKLTFIKESSNKAQEKIETRTMYELKYFDNMRSLDFICTNKQHFDIRVKGGLCLDVSMHLKQ